MTDPHFADEDAPRPDSAPGTGGPPSRPEGEPVSPDPGTSPESAQASAETSDPSPDTAPGPESSSSDPFTRLEQEVARWKDTALRSQAELDNFRKRMAREKSDAIRFGNANLLEDLLPIVDNFHFGLEAARQESEESTVFKGMGMIRKQLSDFLADHGIAEILVEPGGAFDPNLHEAVQQDTSSEIEEGRVIAMVRRGYKLNDRLLRAANVVVSRGPAAPPAEAEAGSTGSGDGTESASS